MTTSAEERRRLLADPTSEYFRSVSSLLIGVKKRQRKEAETVRAEVTLPCADTGEMMRAYQEKFQVHIKKNKNLRMPDATFANLEYLCDGMQMRAKAMGEEEVLVYDYPLPAMAAANGGFMHNCRTYRSASVLDMYREEEDNLVKMVQSKKNFSAAARAKALLSELSRGGGFNVCADARTCTRAVDTILMSFSRSIIDVRQTLLAMQAHEAVRAKLWIMFDIRMLMADAGSFTTWRLHWMVDREKDTLMILDERRTRILVRQVYSVVMEWAMSNVVEVDGYRGLIERYDQVDGLYFCEMIDVNQAARCDTVTETRHSLPLSVPHYYISHRMHFPAASGLSECQAIDVAALVECDLVDKVIYRAERLPDDKCTVGAIRQAVTDYTSQRIVKGTFVRIPEGIGAELMPQFLAVAIYKRTMIERFRSEASRLYREQQYSVMSDESVSAYARALYLAMVQTKCKFSQAWVHVDQVASRVGTPFLADTRVVMRVADSEWVQTEVIAPTTSGGRRQFTPYFPGGGERCVRRGSSSVTTSVDECIDAAEYLEAYNMTQETEEFYDCVSDCGVCIEEEREVVHKATDHKMSDAREQLVDKMVYEFDAHHVGVNRAGILEGVARRPAREKTSVPRDFDPVGTLTEAYDRRHSGVGQFDHDWRAHLRTAEDQHLTIDAKMLKVNAAKTLIPPPQLVRRSEVQAGTSGRRPATQLEALQSLGKRIANAPDVALDCVLADEVERDCQRFADVCFREGWREVVRERVARGMWQSRVSELRKYAAKLDTAKVTRMNLEKFMRGDIDFQSYMFMVKSTPKAKMSSSVASTHVPTQTISYAASKSENAIFSALISEFHDVMDDVLLPSVRINARRDPQGDEDWFNTLNGRRATTGLTNVEVDISQCDKSMGMRTLMIWLTMLKFFSAPEELTRLFDVLLGHKRISSVSLGLALIFTQQNPSGIFGTISINSTAVGVASVRSLELTRDNLVMLAVRGDDVIAQVKGAMELGRSQRNYTDGYNMEAKVFFPKHLYWCSRYWVYMDGWWYWMYDPEKATESLGRSLPAKSDLVEQHQAYQEKMKYYDDWDLCQLVAQAAAERSNREIVSFSEVRALSNLAFGDDALEKFISAYSGKVEELRA